jgi:hypothetical protein
MGRHGQRGPHTSQPPARQQDDDDHDKQASDAGRPIAPVAAVIPRRKHANQGEYEVIKQYSSYRGWLKLNGWHSLLDHAQLVAQAQRGFLMLRANHIHTIRFVVFATEQNARLKRRTT